MERRELGPGWTPNGPALTCSCGWDRLETQISYWLVHQRLRWPLPALLSGCCLRMILETLGWLSECNDQGGFAQISEEQKKVFAFIFLDIKTFRRDYWLWYKILGIFWRKNSIICITDLAQRGQTLLANNNVSAGLWIRANILKYSLQQYKSLTATRHN